MKKPILLAIASLALCFGAKAYDYTDDIYYNPSKPSSSDSRNNSISYYVDINNMDVDEYNRRGQYYYSPVDTIGAYMESEPDFVYTTQIQKYYNPTIVVDNASLIDDVLANSYGNVEIVYNYNGVPSFVPWTSYSWPYYSYSSWYSPYWGVSVGPFSFGIGWNSWYAWDPYWNWGPSWSWSWGWNRPSWGWGWNYPSWGWNRPWNPGPPPPHGGPGWGAPPRPMATYSPGGRQPFQSQRPGYANNSQPGGNYNGGYNSNGRPGTASPRPQQPPTIQHGNSITAGNASTPSFSSGGRQNSTTRPSTPTNVTPGAVSTPSFSTTRPSVNSSTTSRPSTTVTVPSSTTTTRPSTTTTTTRPSTNTTTTRPSTTTTTRPSTSSPSFNSGGRSSGGGSTTRSTGGGGGGRSSGGGGGGGRGGRR